MSQHYFLLASLRTGTLTQVEVTPWHASVYRSAYTQRLLEQRMVFQRELIGHVEQWLDQSVQSLYAQHLYNEPAQIETLHHWVSQVGLVYRYLMSAGYFREISSTRSSILTMQAPDLYTYLHDHKREASMQMAQLYQQYPALCAYLDRNSGLVAGGASRVVEYLAQSVEAGMPISLGEIHEILALVMGVLRMHIHNWGEFYASYAFCLLLDNSDKENQPRLWRNLLQSLPLIMNYTPAHWWDYQPLYALQARLEQAGSF
ncbi:hypothetical protein [Entomospira culicis]|uniref:Uncharacterized protein n=1 Tax=Entomospira culicis TaxID=2719989 RepID=A0A968GGP4_9SPIO|nr:hypothetical protein [Entomospira culicis]NIZ19971.1 hypothetical protein [Entomospira culicis]NIZ70164.1 hypothetical protein [Entomospira culicis]WDI37997.1 hypothetical protein PVA46_08085 [Entomospira culicis]WDI39620.1 hypothetical protein PVA47_08085 [Entomospira culicis]